MKDALNGKIWQNCRAKASPMTSAPSVESMNYQPPSWAAIVAAHARIAARIHRTPVLTSASLDALAGARLFSKCENLQKTGSFKIRGASNAILSLSNEEAARGIVTQSSGNHGAAVACAAAWRSVPAYIVMPRNAPKVKIQAIEAYGGKITFCEPKVSSRKETCDRVQAETGAVLVHPYDDDRIIAGQATAAKELLEDAGDNAVIVVGMNEDRAGFRLHAIAGFFAGRYFRLAEGDFAAVRFNRLDFHFRSVPGHYDVCRHAAPGSRACHGRAMIPARLRHDAACRLLVREREDGIRRAANLERAGLLQVLTLKEKRSSRKCIQ